MRRSESSEIAGRDHPLRPAMLHEELLRQPAVIRRAVMALGLQPCYAYTLRELTNAPIAGKTEA